MPIQQMFLGVGASKKTYLDDVFSTYLYTGDASTQTINNGINLSGEGGLVWAKKRNKASHHTLIDTVRGNTKRLESSTADAEVTSNNVLNSFNANGFTVGYQAPFNESAEPFSTWTFRKAPGFFDVVTYTGNGSNRTIAHSLGSVPGLIMIKRLDSAENWRVYHRSIGHDKILYLNLTSGEYTSTNSWNSTTPTSTVFSLGTHDAVNDNGATYVAYVFAGGESTAATARSVDFDGVGNWDRRLGIADSSDFTVGTNFTAECWYNCRSTPNTNEHHIMGQWDGNSGSESKNSWSLQHYNNQLRFYWVSGGSLYYKSMGNISKKVWHHFAFVKSGSTTKLFVDGEQLVADFDTGSIQDGTGKFTIGGMDGGNGDFDGKVSNVRIVNGTAVYTNSFRPPVEPLTNITNTKLLCCNNSSITGSTVTPGTITAYNSPTASTVHPFDDPAAFTFGENGDQGIIKCGSYEGSGAAQDIYLGWEPQYILFKDADAAENWNIYDSMRGIDTNTTSNGDKLLNANVSATETGGDYIDVTPTGFKITGAAGGWGANGRTHVYMAIRRSDGYVGKPADAGTDVFAMDTGSGGSAIPVFDSGFPVDFALKKTVGSADSWGAGSRLTNDRFTYTDANNAETTNFHWGWAWDSNAGVFTSGASTQQSWMWKRHAGFDVVTRLGNHTQTDQPHSLGQVPEMIWAKIRNNSEDWAVYHKGLNGGTNPEQYRLTLNSEGAEASSSTAWASKAPTSTHFFVGNDADTNGTSDKYIYMLFSSVSGISKVGSYTGNGSNSGPSITTGFSPRFILVKAASIADKPWLVFDTLRGIASGADARLKLDSSDAQNTSTDWLDTTSTGFDIAFNSSNINSSGETYIYYAHA